jgi:hypothetical protein
MCLLALVMIVSTGTRVAAHGGGIDSRGCHNDNKAGNYHCHSNSTCAGQTFPSAHAAIAAGCRRK